MEKTQREFTLCDATNLNDVNVININISSYVSEESIYLGTGHIS